MACHHKSPLSPLSREKWKIMLLSHTLTMRGSKAKDKGNIRVKYPYVLSKYSIIFKNLGIDTQLINLIWQSTQLLPNSKVKIEVSRPEKAHVYYFILWLLHLHVIGVFILHMTNTVIKLVRYNEIPCFKYLNQAFLCVCAFFFCLFYKFYPIYFHFEGIFTQTEKRKYDFTHLVKFWWG